MREQKSRQPSCDFSREHSFEAAFTPAIALKRSWKDGKAVGYPLEPFYFNTILMVNQDKYVLFPIAILAIRH